MLRILLAAVAFMVPAPMPVRPLGYLVGEADYPAAARSQGASGKVGFRLSVDEHGKPDTCLVLESSGSKDLDTATCDLMLARARFIPAHELGGKRVRANYDSAIRWRIEDAPEPAASEAVRIRSTLDPSGRVLSCTVTPAAAATEVGGCEELADAKLLRQLAGRPLTGLAWVELRFIKQVSSDPKIADPLPVGAIRTINGRATMTITPSGAVASCTNDVVLAVDGRSLALCAMYQGPEATAFAPAPGSQARHVALVLETVMQPR